MEVPSRTERGQNVHIHYRPTSSENADQQSVFIPHTLFHVSLLHRRHGRGTPLESEINV